MPIIEDKKGNQCWYDDNGLLHREDDPAYIRGTCYLKWYKHGYLHREDGPAKITLPLPDGERKLAFWGMQKWFINGKLHRKDGPAVILGNGTKKWFINGFLHREDGPAVEYENGNTEYWQCGQRHREDGPAVDYLGLKAWYYKGRLHRENDRPAIVREALSYSHMADQSDNFADYLENYYYALKIKIDLGDRQWWKHGLLSRINRPAIENESGKTEWWINGKRLSKKTIEKYHDRLNTQN